MVIGDTILNPEFIEYCEVVEKDSSKGLRVTIGMMSGKEFDFIGDDAKLVLEVMKRAEAKQEELARAFESAHNARLIAPQ